eukprot:TRINITY_DN834_c0_g2_i1.p1 TRINITY_DN834_c0_g2~~TRINITY_DN834_c0_g2_i1.p1  ORF type:complete len:802 (+),score=121.16 TRINITY_DN834_c0_g2_i1:510-2915(+)
MNEDRFHKATSALIGELTQSLDKAEVKVNQLSLKDDITPRAKLVTIDMNLELFLMQLCSQCDRIHDVISDIQFNMVPGSPRSIPYKVPATAFPRDNTGNRLTVPALRWFLDRIDPPLSGAVTVLQRVAVVMRINWTPPSLENVRGGPAGRCLALVRSLNSCVDVMLDDPSVQTRLRNALLNRIHPMNAGVGLAPPHSPYTPASLSAIPLDLSGLKPKTNPQVEAEIAAAERSQTLQLSNDMIQSLVSPRGAKTGGRGGGAAGSGARGGRTLAGSIPGRGAHAPHNNSSQSRTHATASDVAQRSHGTDSLRKSDGAPPTNDTTNFWDAADSEAAFQQLIDSPNERAGGGGRDDLSPRSPFASSGRSSSNTTCASSGLYTAGGRGIGQTNSQGGKPYQSEQVLTIPDDNGWSSNKMSASSQMRSQRRGMLSMDEGDSAPRRSNGSSEFQLRTPRDQRVRVGRDVTDSANGDLGDLLGKQKMTVTAWAQINSQYDDASTGTASTDDMSVGARRRKRSFQCAAPISPRHNGGHGGDSRDGHVEDDLDAMLDNLAKGGLDLNRVEPSPPRSSSARQERPSGGTEQPEKSRTFPKLKSLEADHLNSSSESSTSLSPSGSEKKKRGRGHSNPTPTSPFDESWERSSALLFPSKHHSLETHAGMSSNVVSSGVRTKIHVRLNNNTRYLIKGIMVRLLQVRYPKEEDMLKAMIQSDSCRSASAWRKEGTAVQEDMREEVCLDESKFALSGFPLAKKKQWCGVLPYMLPDIPDDDEEGVEYQIALEFLLPKSKHIKYTVPQRMLFVNVVPK